MHLHTLACCFPLLSMAQVDITAIYSGSILVQSSVTFFQANSFTLPQQFAATLM